MYMVMAIVSAVATVGTGHPNMMQKKHRWYAVSQCPGEVYCRIYYAGLTIIKEFKAPDNVSLAIEDNSDLVAEL